ncbi:hypothetical protein V2J09_012426 [Rumex salicifolius]
MASSTAKDHLPAAAATQQGTAFSSSSSSAAQVAEDESRKKNTDCVYFLASPLTCKKGSECDYRHSEYARVNPRDCWYWLNGTCLNPKCSFRHPPLDTSLGTPADSSAGSSMPGYSSATVGSTVPPSHTVATAPHTASKPTAPCIFFQSGYCLKGDRCPFFHMQNPTSYRAPEFPATNMPESSRFNSASGGLKNCSQKVAPQGNVSKPIEAVLPQPKTSVNAVKAVPRDVAFSAKTGMLPHHNVSNEDIHKLNETTFRSNNNGSSRNKSSYASLASPRDDQRFQSGKESADDLQRESSPGFDFDVLVDDEGGDAADYYGNDDQFPGIRGHEGKNLNEFDNGHPDRYQSLDDPVVFHDRHGYENYKPMQERRARDTSDRTIIDYDRRSANKGVNPDGTRNSDLRQRLSKQRRTNGLSSAVNTDYPSDKLGEEHRYRTSRRDSRHSPPRGSSISSRLQGRIKLPGQASAVNPPSIRSEREYDRGRNYPRLSPSRPQLQSHRGRLQDRLKGKVQDDIGTGRDAIISRRDVLDHNSFNFVAPKSLAELKKGKQSHSQSREQLNKIEELTPLGKRKALEGSRQAEDDFSFEPPKPLCEILKRKRKAEDNNNAQGGMAPGAEDNSAVEKQAANKEEDNKASSEAHNLDFDDKTKPTETEISQANNVSEGEEGLITDGVEGHEPEEESYEEGDGVYEEEQDGGEGYNLDGENGEIEEEYMDEDEDDSFAKKIGVMFS